MAPEGFDPAIGRLSAKCDVYSFAVGAEGVGRRVRVAGVQVAYGTTCTAASPAAGRVARRPPAVHA
jgi:hypothetical protein